MTSDPHHSASPHPEGGKANSLSVVSGSCQCAFCDWSGDLADITQHAIERHPDKVLRPPRPVFPGGDRPGQADAAVAVPVARWEWKTKGLDKRYWLPCDAEEADRRSKTGRHDVRPLYASPEAALHAPKQGEQGDGWRDIASAPKDGTWIILGAEDRSGKGEGWSKPDRWMEWNHNPETASWDQCRYLTPSHWRPLPAPPTAAPSEGTGGGEVNITVAYASGLAGSSLPKNPIITCAPTDAAPAPGHDGESDAAHEFHFDYRNHRGEYGRRRVWPTSVRFGSTDWHPEPQWLLLAYDLDKQDDREFAMSDIGASRTPPTPPASVAGAVRPDDGVTEAEVAAAHAVFEECGIMLDESETRRALEAARAATPTNGASR